MAFSAVDLNTLKKYYLPFKQSFEHFIELEQQDEPSCAGHLVRTDYVGIYKDDIEVTTDGKVIISNEELHGYAQAVKDGNANACRVVLQYHLRHPDAPPVFLFTSLDRPGGAETPPPLVSVCHD